MSSNGPRINFAVSSHGYGHLTQSIAVARALFQHNPDCILRFQCDIPEAVIRDRLGNIPFALDKRKLDIGLIQTDPLTVDLAATARAYSRLHTDFPEKVTREAENLANWGTDLLIADIPYLSIAAASKANINTIALASLSWDRIIGSYFDLTEKSPHQWHTDICSAYKETSLALLPEPALDGRAFTKRKLIPPVCMDGIALTEFRSRLNIPNTDERPVALCSLGGIPSRNLPLQALLQDDDFHWLVHTDNIPSASNIHSTHVFSHAGYQNIIASVDALVSKPGYGTSVEAVKYNLPFVYTCRGDFPDEPVIAAWLEKHARSREISQKEWLDGIFGTYLKQLFEQSPKSPISMNGAEVASSHISKYL